MKNMKRAYRRYKKEVHLKRRARNYYDYSFSMSINEKNLCWADYWEEVNSGKSGKWMRHTGKTCSCYTNTKNYTKMHRKLVLSQQ